MIPLLLVLALAQEPAMQAPFDAMEKAIRAGDEAAFRAAWHRAGYSENLVGGSGLPGQSVFKQGTRKRWYPKPDLEAAAKLGDGAAAIVPCKIWSWVNEEAKDAVDFLVVKHGGAWVLLGGGENRKEVEALAAKWLKKEIAEPAALDAATSKAAAAIFDALEKALAAKDEAAFKAPWHADAYARNLVGGSGIPGSDVFAQGTRKNWYPKPDLGGATVLEGALVVPCGIWSRAEGKALDKVDFLLVKQGDAWVILGGGERRPEVLALAERWRKKEPLDPPTEPPEK